jgi:hypothetical protein
MVGTEFAPVRCQSTLDSKPRGRHHATNSMTKSRDCWPAAPGPRWRAEAENLYLWRPVGNQSRPQHSNWSNYPMSRHSILRLTAIGFASFCSGSHSLAASWKELPANPGQWINLEEKQRSGSTVEFTIVGDPNQSKDKLPSDTILVYAKIDCSTGQYRVVVPASGNSVRRMPDLSQADPLRRLICG